MTHQTCPACGSRAVSARMPDSPEVLTLICRGCDYEWEVQADRVPANVLSRLAPLPHWR